MGNYIPPEEKKPRSKKEPNCANKEILLSDLVVTDENSGDKVVKLKLRQKARNSLSENML